MRLDEFTLMVFAACNGIRIAAYLPQIYKAATDSNGAAAISLTTWALFAAANASTVAYALVNQSDAWLAACFAVNAACCLAILAIACWKGRRARASRRPPGAGPTRFGVFTNRSSASAPE
jgi:cyanate permease